MSRPVLILPEMLASAPAAALLVSVPAAFRLAGERVGLLEAWIASAGLLCPLLAVGIAASRSARRAARPTARAAGVALLVGTALWLLVSLPATAALGAFLKTNTHHRALGGATFAILALVVHAGAGLVAWRVTVIALPRIRRAPTRTAFAWAFGAAALALIVVTVASGARAGDGSSQAGPAARIPALLVDGAFAIAATAVAAALDVPRRRSFDVSWLGGGSFVFVVAVGFALAARSPSLSRRLVVEAPLAGLVSEALGLSGDPR